MTALHSRHTYTIFDDIATESRTPEGWNPPGRLLAGDRADDLATAIPGFGKR